ncbi:MAG: DUF5663 domain-containing protein [bacterium]|nr:DUF5663 domain-containing protein [bacterium]
MTTNAKQVGQDMKQNILTTFQIEKLPEEERMDAVNEIGKIIFQMVLIRVLPTMTEEEVKEYESLIDGGVEAEGLMEFFFEKVPGFLDILAQETENLRKSAGEIMQYVKGE